MTEAEAITIAERAMAEIESLRAEIARLRRGINEVVVKNCSCPPCRILIATLQPPATGQEVPP